jgi:hypothetical protein
LHLPFTHQPEHFEIPKQGPQWINKGCRFIFLNKKMTVPGKKICTNGNKEGKIIIVKNRGNK